MAYATAARAVSLYGEDFVTVGCDRDQDGVRDPGVFESFLDLATNEIDGYLVGRDPLPLSPVPPQIEIYCIDIAIYRARPTADVLTEEVKDRYRAAIRYLENVQRNKIRLVPDSATGDGTVNVAVQAEAFSVSVNQGERTWTRDRMRGL